MGKKLGRPALLTSILFLGLVAFCPAQAKIDFRQKGVVTRYPDLFAPLPGNPAAAPVPQDQQAYYTDHVGVYLREDLVPWLPSRLLNFEVRWFSWGPDLWYRAYDVGYFDYSFQDKNFMGYFGGQDGDYTLAQFLKYRQEFDRQTLQPGWRRASRPGHPGEFLGTVVADQRTRTAAWAKEFLPPSQAADQVGKVQAGLIQAWSHRDWETFLGFVSRKEGLRVSFTEAGYGSETHPWKTLKEKVASWKEPRMDVVPPFSDLSAIRCPLADGKTFQLLLSQVLPYRGTYVVFPNVFVGEDIGAWRGQPIRPIVCEYQIFSTNQGTEQLTDTRLTLGFVPEEGTWRLYRVSGWTNLE